MRWKSAALAVAFTLVVTSAAHADFGPREATIDFRAEDGSVAIQAGSHPFTWTTDLTFSTSGEPGKELPEGSLKDLRIRLPSGLAGTPALVPRCSHSDFGVSACPSGSMVGSAELRLSLDGSETEVEQLYNLVPRPGVAAELGLVTKGAPVAIQLLIDPVPPHVLVAKLQAAPQVAPLFGIRLTVSGVAGDRPLLTLPRSCSGPLAASFEAVSWEEQGLWTPPLVALTHDDSDPPQPLGLSWCEVLGFEARVDVAATTDAAAGPSGLDLSLDLPTDGLTSPDGTAQADLRAAFFDFPAGMDVNASLAEGLGACRLADIARETLVSTPGEGCPEASKLGTAEVESPLLEEPLAGSLFLAQPDDPATAGPGEENPFDALLAFYLVFKDPQRGILLEVPFEAQTDHQTGRLRARVEDLPDLPFSRLEFHLHGGARAPLVTPSGCGVHSIGYSLVPSSGGPSLNGASPFDLDRGCGPAGFGPALAAGVTNPVAGASSSFVLDLRQEDREENLSRLALSLPPGLSASFAGVPRCPAGLAAVGSCPPASRLGSARIAAGTGAVAWIPPPGAPPGDVYLAGPYRGAPFSLAVVIPAAAGPFDLGTVVVRGPVFVDPESAQAKIELDPLPQILSGFPIAYRAIRLSLDRPGGIRNPTSCAPMAIRGDTWSSRGTQAALSSRFQVGDCANLHLNPRISIRLLGSSRRGAHPQLRALIRPRRGDANLRRVALTLPRSLLLAIRQVRAICSKRQFASSSCPDGALYGHARASTPLLDEALEGPVYLRQSSARLPELVAALEGEVDLVVVANVDAVRGRLRATFRDLPDVPLGKLVLTMHGGRRGLFVNSGGACDGKQRARVSLRGHNGKVESRDVPTRSDCGSR